MPNYTTWNITKHKNSRIIRIFSFNICSFMSIFVLKLEQKNNRHGVWSREVWWLKKKNTPMKSGSSNITMLGIYTVYLKNIQALDYSAGFLLLGGFAQRAAGLQVRLPLHLDGDGVEVEGGETSLGHFSQGGLSINGVVWGETENQNQDVRSVVVHLIKTDGVSVKLMEFQFVAKNKTHKEPAHLTFCYYSRSSNQFGH